MSMYSLVFGQNPFADFILGTLNLKREDVGRFRDAFVSEGKIAVYTRNGGGNRDHWEYSYKEQEGEGCPCPGCIITYRLPKHPMYLSNQDDDFDCTYATIFFKLPDEAKIILEAMQEKEKFDPDKRWTESLEALKAGKSPEVVEKMEPVIDAIRKALK